MPRFRSRGAPGGASSNAGRQ